MAWFTSEYEAFFKELKEHNDRDWFNAEKKRYEKHVKKPFEQFVGDMILRMQEVDPECKIAPKDAIFRIYRDTRFSKDKTPYKTQMSAVIGRGGRKETSLSGMYVELGDQHLRMYGGVYQPDKEQLHSIRQEILYNMDEFSDLLDDKNFKKLFGEIRGEKNKRLPADFAEAMEEQPLIANKQFYYFAQLDSALITSDKLIDKLFDAFEKSLPMRQFLHRSLGD